MSKGEARLAADGLLRDAHVTAPPVRLSKLLRSQRVALEKAKLDVPVSSILFRGRKPRIVVNQRLGRDQRRFSIAHSLGHYLLHDRSASVIVTDLALHLRVGAPPQNDMRELEANRFALELLLPEYLLRKDLEGSAGIDLSDEREIGRLAARYRVSPQILTFRASRLGLVWGI